MHLVARWARRLLSPSNGAADAAPSACAAQRPGPVDPVLQAWRPAGGIPRISLRWLVSYWCNYRCPYCEQDHDRRVALPVGRRPHAFDNHPVQEWIEGFARHFRQRRLVLTLTGGEPLLDSRAMPVFLQALTSMETLDVVRIDTNASFKPALYSKVDLRKIALMCTFHPSQVSEERFFRKLDELLDRGFRIAMVNYVMAGDAIGQFERRREQLAEKGIPLHPDPLWNSQGAYSPLQIELMCRHLPDLDFRYRMQIESPRGRKCRFPMLGYQMDPRGMIHVGCHPKRNGSFFGAELPVLFPHLSACPQRWCTCLDMYSFLEGEERNQSGDPLWAYREALLRRVAPQSPGGKQGEPRGAASRSV